MFTIILGHEVGRELAHMARNNCICGCGGENGRMKPCERIRRGYDNMKIYLKEIGWVHVDFLTHKQPTFTYANTHKMKAS